MAEITIDQELEILFGAFCDGLRQEARARWLARHITESEQLAVSLTQGRESEIATSLALHTRLAGFFVQTESYFATGDERRRPDFRIWLPVTKKYLFLEFKTVAWGDDDSYRTPPALEDIKKLSLEENIRNLPNGLLVVGFSKSDEGVKNHLMEVCMALSKQIEESYPLYEEVGRELVDLNGMDERTSYAAVYLWVRKA